ncbi:MAG: LCP family protein [Clostridia bacterium]|nr:LCP family protein [Clostridia bacterium]
MPRKPKNLMFRTTRQNSGNDNKKFAAILIASVVLILAVSIFVIMSKNDFDVKNVLGGDAVSETQAQPVDTQENEIEASKTYFLWCADDSENSLYFAWLVNFTLPERRVTVCALDLDTRLDEAGSIRQVFKSDGIKELVSCMEAAFETDIDGYIGSDDGSFKSMINYFGGIDITVPEQIEYRSGDLTVILVKGRQNLKGDSLFKYLRYLGTLGEKGRSLQAAALSEMLDFVFKPSNLNRCSSIFSRISNTLETDLTIVDYSSAEEGIKQFVENGISSKRTADTPEEMEE